MRSSRPTSRSDELAGQLARRFDLAKRRVDLGDRTVEVLHPAHPDALIDESDFDRDERLPYWADLWPSAIVLARHVASLDGRGRSFLELGCGVGLVAIAAAGAGFETTATDYYEDALAFTEMNAAGSGGPAVRTLLLDWREVPSDMVRFDLVAAADVLYERRYPRIVADAIACTLAPDGEAIVADPGRSASPDLPGELARAGLAIRHRSTVPYQDRHIRQTIEMLSIRW